MSNMDDAPNRGVSQNHGVHCGATASHTFDARTELRNAHVGCRRERECRRKASPDGMHGESWVDGVIDLTAISANAREQNERRQGLPATAIDLIRRPFGQDEAIASCIDEIEQCGLSGDGHIGLERRISRTTRKDDDSAETRKRRVRAVVLIGRNRRDGRRKSSCGQCGSERSCAGRTVVGNDQDVLRTHARGVGAHAGSAFDSASAAIVGIVQGIEFAAVGWIAVAIGKPSIATGQRAHTADTRAHAVRRIGTHHPAHAAIHFIAVEGRFAAIGDHHVAIVESRLARSDRAHAHRTRARPIGDSRTRHSATTAMPDVRFRIGFAAVERTAQAIGKTSDAAPDAARVPSTSWKPIGNGGTNVAASSAMRDCIG